MRPTRQLVAQDNDLKLALTAAADEHADNPTEEPVEQARQHGPQSAPLQCGSPARPSRNRVSLPHT
jgi:hypothetical protein